MKAGTLMTTLNVSWRNIPISLIDAQKGEQTAQAYEKA